jgi:hypothetical protein
MTMRTLVALGALIGGAAAAAAQPAPVTLKWSELGPRIAKSKIELVLPDSTALRGKVRGVEPDGLLVDISKTSDKMAHPKGLQLIPRQSVSLMRVTRYRKLGRILCTAGVVAAAGAFAAVAARDSGITEGGVVIAIPAAGTVGTVGLGIAGYYAGKAIDKRVAIIRVAPGD